MSGRMLRLDNVTLRIAGRVLLDGASVHLPAGHKVGLIGRNGTGKTSLLRLVEGELHAETGTLMLRNGAKLGSLAQEAPSGERTPLEIVLAADPERLALLAEAEATRDAARLAELHARLTDIAAAAAPARAATILAGLGLSAAQQTEPVEALSGGWRMRVALAAALFAEPDLLLLDEPTNHLDFEAALWLEGFLKSYPRTVLLVSHDREFLNGVASHILHLDQEKLTLYSGDYDRFERTRAERLARQAALHAQQEVQRRHMQAFIDRFRAKASKARQAQSRLKALARLQPIAAVMEARAFEFRFPTPTELPPPLVTMERIAVGYGDTPVLRRLDLRVDQDDRIALLGPNGNGKTTLARLISGRLKPAAGELRRHPKLRIGYFAQHQLEELEEHATPYGHMRRLMPEAPEDRVRARLGQFAFPGAKADVKVSDLSGGEKARLLFALITHDAPQLLILDEPTNHLDIDAREALIRALNDYAGAVILVSHDSHILETVADRLWLVADGTVQPFDGDLEEYRRLVLASVRPPSASATERSSRRDQRREAAELRQRLAPLRKQAKDAEARIHRLTADKAAVDARLGDAALYEPARQAEVVALKKQQADLAREIETAEVAWLAAAAELEAAELVAES
jgi:ATP-binding cassette, subfamily F, member 3